MTLSNPAGLRRLRRLNLAAALLHLVNTAGVLALANGFALPVTARYMTGPPGSQDTLDAALFSLPTGLAVAAFCALSALFHLLAATVLRARYEGWVGAGRNPMRWVEYSMSSTVMIVVISQLCGITDVSALIAVCGANIAMILFGWLQERYESPGGSLLAFWFGCIAGAAPWIAIGVYALTPGADAPAPPAFVYAIVVSLFAFFNCFALTQWLQYRRVGRFSRPLVAERTYLVLSLAAKTALAWQVFGGTLAG